MKMIRRPFPALPAEMVPISSKLMRYRGRSRLPDHQGSGWELNPCFPAGMAAQHAAARLMTLLLLPAGGSVACSVFRSAMTCTCLHPRGGSFTSPFGSGPLATNGISWREKQALDGLFTRFVSGGLAAWAIELVRSVQCRPSDLNVLASR